MPSYVITGAARGLGVSACGPSFIYLLMDDSTSWDLVRIRAPTEQLSGERCFRPSA